MVLKRKSWLDVLSEDAGGQRLRPGVRDALARLDDVLFDLWSLGGNVVLVWTRRKQNARFLAVRHYTLLETHEPTVSEGRSTANEYMNNLLAGDKFVDHEGFETIHATLNGLSRVISVPLDEDISAALVSRLVIRYGVTLIRERAVVLLDAVGFALRTPLEQVAMLNSLSYSVNSAYGQLSSRNLPVNFARTTTGDGFYIWNRARTADANMALYKLMMLILADNAIAQRQAERFPVPQLRAAFHIGEHYEFYQVEALNPTTFGYIVGHVTIELARMIEKALPGQIVLGDFPISGADNESVTTSRSGTIEFVADTEATLDRLQGLEIGGDRIRSVRCYLTGKSAGDGTFSADRYSVTDKHGIARCVYNAKVNIHCEHAEPIFLGIQREVLHRHAAHDFPGLVV